MILDFGFWILDYSKIFGPRPPIIFREKVYGKRIAPLRPFDNLVELSPDQSKIQNLKSKMDQTRLRFGGLHPLCGIGVVSRIEVTRIPA